MSDLPEYFTSTRRLGPGLSNIRIIVLDRHAIQGQVAKTFYPCLLEARDRFVQHSEHMIREIDMGKHVLPRLGEGLAEKVEICLHPVAPDPAGGYFGRSM